MIRAQVERPSRERDVAVVIPTVDRFTAGEQLGSSCRIERIQHPVSSVAATRISRAALLSALLDRPELQCAPGGIVLVSGLIRIYLTQRYTAAAAASTGTTRTAAPTPRAADRVRSTISRRHDVNHAVRYYGSPRQIEISAVTRNAGEVGQFCAPCRYEGMPDAVMTPCVVCHRIRNRRIQIRR